MQKPEWKCIQCGKCCFMYGCMIPASDDDLARWKKQGRQDILDMAMIARDPKTNRIIAAELWWDRSTGREFVYCPWIKKKKDGKVYCQIHDTKPQYCRDYICRKYSKQQLVGI